MIRLFGLALIAAVVPAAQAEDAVAQKLFHDLTDDRLEVREQATRRLIEEYERFEGSVGRRLKRGAELSPEERARLEAVSREGPLAAERRALERKLGADFAQRNGAALKGLFSEEEDRFVQGVDDLYRKNPDRSDDGPKVECFLFAFHRARAKGWKRGLETADMFLVQEWRPALRERITASIRPGIRDPDEEVAWRSVRLLAEAGEGARSELEKLMEDPRPQVASVAFSQLGDLVEARDVPWVAGFLKDRDPRRRETALLILVRLEAADQADAIAALLDDPMHFVRRVAVDALGQLKSDRHARRLVPLLADEVPGGADARSEAFGALQELRSEPAEDESVKLLAHPDAKVRLSSVFLLGHWKASRHAVSVAPLLADGDEDVRAAAVDALVAMGSKLDVEGIARRLDDPSAKVRARAAVALGALEVRAEAERIVKLAEEKKLAPDDAAEAMVRMKSQAHGGKAAELLLGVAREIYPERKPGDPPRIVCRNDIWSVRDRRLRKTLLLAVEGRYEACLEALAKGAPAATSEAQSRIYEALGSGQGGAALRTVAAGALPATPEGRGAAMKALASAPDAQTLAAAMALVRAADEKEIFHLHAYALGFKTVPGELVRYLEDRDAKVRGLAGRLLCEARDARFVPQILKLLEDPDRDVRAAMLQHLQYVPTREHHAALAGLLRDPDPWVRCVAARVVSQLDLRDHAGDVAALLRNAPERGFDPRADGIEALVSLEARGLAKEIVPLLGDPVVGPRAIRALGELRAEGEAAVLAGIAREGSGAARAEAVRALAAMGKKEALPEIGPLLDRPDPALRAAAAFAAGALKETGLEEALAGRLRDAAPQVQAEAARALGARGRAGAIEERVGSKEWAVWNGALEALVRLEARDLAPAILRRLEDGDASKAYAGLRALVRLDAKGHMGLLVNATGWGSTIYYELNSVRAPRLYAEVGKTRLAEYGLLGFRSSEDLAKGLEAAHGIRLRFDPAVPPEARQRSVHLSGLWKETHGWLEAFAIPRECAPLFDEEKGEIRMVPLEEAKRFWLEWAGRK